jgi:DNA-binding beta-propeller fold protein YncE
MEHSWIQGLHEPAGIAIFNDFIYVSSITRSLIYKINCKNGYYESWKPTFHFCNSLAVCSKNQTLYSSSFMETNIEQISLETGNSSQHYFTYDSPYGIAIEDNIMYISNQEKNFISQTNLEKDDPTNPLIPWIRLTFKPYYLVTHGDYLYISNYDTNSISCVTISTKELHESIITGLQGPLGMAIEQKFLYIANKLSGTITVYDISVDPLNPIVKDDSYVTDLQSPYDIVIQDNYLYVTNFESGTIGKNNLYPTITEQLLDEPKLEILKEEPILEKEPILEEELILEEESSNFIFSNTMMINKRKWRQQILRKQKLKSLFASLKKQKIIHSSNNFDINRIDPSPFIRYTNII